jgi:hypothetical protein
VSAGIVRLKAAALNIPEADCCGEAVEYEDWWLIPLEKDATTHGRVRPLCLLKLWSEDKIDGIGIPTFGEILCFFKWEKG